MVISQNRLSLAKSLPHAEGRGARVHILALGDVGATLLLGLKVLGAGTIDTIGIYDVNPNVLERYEREMNQMGWAFEESEAEDEGTAVLPEVVILKEEELFDCDLFLFGIFSEKTAGRAQHRGAELCIQCALQSPSPLLRMRHSPLQIFP